MAAKKIRTEIRRRQITDAAVAIIASDGVRGLSISKIAQRVGMAPSNLYRHYQGKEEVIGSVLERFGKMLAENVKRARDDRAGSLDRLECVLLRHAGMVTETRVLPAILFSEEVFLGRGALKRRLQRALDEYFAGIESIVREGRKRGEIRRDVSPRMVPTLLMSAVVPALLFWHLSGGGFDLRRRVRGHWALIREMLGAQPGRTREG